MPLCYCYTSLKDSDIPEGFETRFANFIQQTLPDKPIERISVILVPGTRICKAGSTAPSMLIQLRSIGVFNPANNEEYFPKFFKFLTSEIKDLPENRYTIEFVDIKATDARNGK